MLFGCRSPQFATIGSSTGHLPHLVSPPLFVAGAGTCAAAAGQRRRRALDSGCGACHRSAVAAGAPRHLAALAARCTRQHSGAAGLGRVCQCHVRVSASALHAAMHSQLSVHALPTAAHSSPFPFVQQGPAVAAYQPASCAEPPPLPGQRGPGIPAGQPALPLPAPQVGGRKGRREEPLLAAIWMCMHACMKAPVH